MVSIIVPTHNSENYIARTLDSILNQSYTEIEIIIVDDASSDSTVSIVNEFSKSDGRNRIITSGVHIGVSNSRLMAAGEAKGEWVMFVDDDDQLPWFAIEVLLNFDNGRRDIISGTIAIDGRIIPAYNLKGDITLVEYINGLLLSATYDGPCAKLIRSSLFKQGINIPREIILNEDLLMMVALVQNAREIFILNSLPVYNYIQRTDSHSRTSSQGIDSWLCLFSCLKPYVDGYADSVLTRSFATFMIHRIYHFLIQRGSFVSVSNPQIADIIDYARNAGVSSFETLKQMRCINSFWRQRGARVKYLIVNSIKTVGRYVLIKTSLISRHYILKNLY